MAPAEILQGGKKINKIQGGNTHEGQMNGKKVFVEDNPPGCNLKVDTHTNYLPHGSSVTLDGGEIVKSVSR